MKKSIKKMFFVMVAVLFVGGCDQVNNLIGGQSTEPASKAVSQPVAERPAEPMAQQARPLSANEIAVVGDWRLTMDQFNERLDNVSQALPDFDPADIQAQALILDELIRQELIVQEAERLGLHKTREIQQAIDDFRRTLLVQELTTEIVDGIVVTEQDARDYYESNPDLFVVPVEYKLREIAVYTESGAKNLLVQILQGADFAAMARERSVIDTASNGGDLGYVQQAPFAEMQTVVNTLKPGNVSSVFEGPDGYFYIVKVEDKRGGSPRPFEDIKNQLIEGLTAQQQQQAVLERLSEIAEETTIEINQDYFGGAEESPEEE